MTIFKLLALLMSYITKPKEVVYKVENPATIPTIPNEIIYITIEDYFMGRDIEYKEDITEEIRDNAAKLLKSVNAFLSKIGNDKKYVVSSGWRPLAINSKLSNSSKKSLHMVGSAIDIQDSDNALQRLIEANKAMLKEHGLWLENPQYTKGWIHLDNKQRSNREYNIFNP